jgi:outer membrane autotransporter protein
MKKTIIATAVIASATLLAACTANEAKAEGVAPAFEVSPYVGAERQTEADTTIAYFGATASKGALDLTAQVDVDLKDDLDQRGDIANLNLDGSFAVNDNVSLYTENDFNDSFDRTETKVGVKYTF